MKNLMVAAALVAVTTGVAFAQGGNTGYDQSQQQPQQQQNTTNAQGMTGNMSDANLTAMLKAINDHEVREGKMAEKKTKSPAVKKFARMMIREHGQNNKEISSISKRIGLQPSANEDVTALKDQAKSDAQALESQTGAEFDKAYVDQMVKGHQDALQKLDQAIAGNQGRNSELSTFLTKTRQAVSRHLEMAQRLQNEVSGSTQGSQGTENMPNMPGGSQQGE